MNKPAIIPLSAKMSEMCLRRYFERFLDRQRFSFNTHLMLEALRKRRGHGSSGYNLWDYLRSSPRERPYVISEQTMKSYAYKLGTVLIYWDCCYMEPESPFSGANQVCMADFGDLMEHMSACPPNLYLFDRDMQWTLIRTDVPQNDWGWTCIQIGAIGSGSR